MLIKRFVAFGLIGALALSCAAPFKILNPQQMSFSNYKSGNGVDYALRGNVLADAGNTRYANKEMKTGLRVVAVEIENKTDRPIVLRENAKFYVGTKNVYPVEAAQIAQQLKQPAGLYMLWSLLWVVITKCDNNDCSVIPLPVGFAIGLGNMSKAKKANKALLDELNANNILDKKLMPGEKAKGLFGFGEQNIDAIRIEIN
jgi:hypothetical protein